MKMVGMIADIVNMNQYHQIYLHAQLAFMHLHNVISNQREGVRKTMSETKYRLQKRIVKMNQEILKLEEKRDDLIEKLNDKK